MAEKRKKRTTLKDIAERVGVSVNTVSGVLNNRSVTVRVSPETRRAILSTAQELGYKGSRQGRPATGKFFRTIGILIPAIHSPFSATVTDAFEREVLELGYQCFACRTLYDEMRLAEYVERLLEHDVDGLLILSILGDVEAEKGVRYAFERNLPMILVDNVWKKSTAPLVCSDDHKGGRLLGEHLLEVGHRNFIFLGLAFQDELASVQDRYQGFRQVLSEAGLGDSVVRRISFDNFDVTGLANMITPHLGKKGAPTVVVCTNDMIAAYLIAGLNDRGFSVPDDIAVTGYDDLNMMFYGVEGAPWAGHFPLSLSLSTIRQPIRELGREAGRLLVRQIEHGDVPLDTRRVFDVELVVRNSSKLPNNRK